MQNRIWLSPPHLTGEENLELTEVLRTNWIAPIGPHLIKFEELLENYLKPLPSKGEGEEKYYVCALNSGTSAIHLALIEAGIQPNDEVLCPTLTFAATVNPVLYLKAKPIFVGVEKTHWNLSAEWLEIAIKDRISKGKKPKALLWVHLYGLFCPPEPILKICSEYEIIIIEDSAEALGSTYYNQKAGTFGEYSIFSFNGNKIITTSSGGVLCSKNQGKIIHANFLSTQAKDPYPFYHHSELGFNYKMSNVLAALGIPQLKILDERVEKRRQIFEIYEKELNPLGFIPQFEIEGLKSNRWLSAFYSPISPSKLIQVLENNNIESRRIWNPLHKQTLFETFPYYGDEVADFIFDNGICLPSGSSLTFEEQMRIIDVIKKEI